MLKEKYIPTPLVEKKQRKKVEIVQELKSRPFRNFYVIWRFVVYYLGVLLRKYTGKSDIEKTAIGLRKLFEEFGGLWVKTGQLLALRTDLFDQEICDELRKLQYGALGFPIEIVRSTVESELKHPIEKVFAHFDDEPLAAASIAQIHRAVLLNKKQVVVKVQRPNIEKTFQQDLDVIKNFINFLKFLGRLRLGPLRLTNIDLGYLRLDEAVREVERIFKEELDYRYEAYNMRRMKKTLKEHGVYTPSLYRKYSKRRVLVMEYIPGVLMSDYIRTLGTDPARVEKWDEANNVDRDKVGEKLSFSLFRQVYEDNLYHADLHPGNIFLLRDSKFVLIDLGSAGSLDEALKTNYTRYTEALGAENYPKAADYIIRFGIDTPLETDVPKVRSEMARALELWADRAKLDGLSFREKSIGSATADVTKISAKYKVPTNWGFLKVSRSFLTLDGSLQYLLPDYDFLKLIQKYNKQKNRRNLIRRIRFEGIMASVDKLVETVDEYNNLILPLVREVTIPYDRRVITRPLRISKMVIDFISSFLTPAGSLFLAYTWLHKKNPLFQKATPEPLNIVFNQVNVLADQVPDVPNQDWVVFFILIGLIWIGLFMISNTLGEGEYQRRSIE